MTSSFYSWSHGKKIISYPTDNLCFMTHPHYFIKIFSNLGIMKTIYVKTCISTLWILPLALYSFRSYMSFHLSIILSNTPIYFYSFQSGIHQLHFLKTSVCILYVFDINFVLFFVYWKWFYFMIKVFKVAAREQKSYWP